MIVYNDNYEDDPNKGVHLIGDHQVDLDRGTLWLSDAGLCFFHDFGLEAVLEYCGELARDLIWEPRDQINA